MLKFYFIIVILTLLLPRNHPESQNHCPLFSIWVLKHLQRYWIRKSHSTPDQTLFLQKFNFLFQLTIYDLQSKKKKKMLIIIRSKPLTWCNITFLLLSTANENHVRIHVTCWFPSFDIFKNISNKKQGIRPIAFNTTNIFTWSLNPWLIF